MNWNNFVIFEFCYSRSRGTQIGEGEKRVCGSTLGVLIYIFWCRTDNTNIEVIYSRWKDLSEYFTVG